MNARIKDSIGTYVRTNYPRPSLNGEIQIPVGDTNRGGEKIKG